MAGKATQAAHLFRVACTERAALRYLGECVARLVVAQASLESAQRARFTLAQLPLPELERGMQLYRGGGDGA